MRRVRVYTHNLLALQEQIRLAKAHLGLPAEASVFSWYGADRGGFWLHRYLVRFGIDNQVLDASSIKVDRRRAKTDRLDEERMPTPEQEDARRLHREQLWMKDEGKGHRIRITALLIT